MKNTCFLDRSFKVFTLLELLVVISIVCILASLLLPALSKAKAAGRSAQCLNNLRECGIATLSYAGDYNGWALINHYPNGPVESETVWHRMLFYFSYLPESNDKAVIRCPAFEPYSYYKYCCYGVCREITSASQPGATWSKQYINFGKVASPSKYIYYADTICANSSVAYAYLKFQFFDFAMSYAGDGALHLRHALGANGWFVDGHAASQKRRALAELGINQACMNTTVIDL